MVKTAFADVTVDGGERNDDGFRGGRKGRIHDFGQRASERADGIVFEVMDELADEAGAIADDKSGRSLEAMRATAGRVLRMANWANVLAVFNHVIFTTVTKWLS